MDSPRSRTRRHYRRHLASAVLEALADTPAVMVHGPRQAGKSTLARSLISDSFPAEYVTFDDLVVLGAARASPSDFLARFDGPVIVDEVQRVPQLFPALKAEIDRRREPGRYLLTGSANARVVPEISDALVGRVEILTLWPLSQGEIEGRRERFLDAVYSGEIPQPAERRPVALGGVLSRALVGGFPDAVRRTTAARRREWFAAYITTVLQREVRDLAAIEKVTELPHLLALIATRAGGLQNVSDLARASGLPHTTLKRYLALLRATFMVESVPAWSANLGRRLTKSPKLFLSDTGLLAHLLGLEEAGLDASGAAAGSLLESFVVAELRRQLGWSEVRPAIHHFRSARQEEVDVLLEDRRQRVVGIEIKASSSVEKRDFRHLETLREDLGDRFVAGLVLHTGREAASFGPRLHAVPVGYLWRCTGP